VAKHGNRSNTSRSGSADLLEALGVQIELEPTDVARSIEEIGFGFMFAPRHHAAMKHVVPVRKELAVRTIFNVLGPLTNPAGATRQLLGVSDRRYQETIAEALLGLGCERALGVSAEDGLDEIAGGSPEENATVVESVLDGDEGPARDVVVLNAGAAILAGGSATDLGDGMDRAREAIDRGAAKGVLDKLRALASPTG
jgi:anthranilate phosphoribosyltransferase